MKKFLFTIAAIIALGACSKKDDPEPTPVPPTTAQRTVLVYMSGENSLSRGYDSSTGQYYSFLAEDLVELIEGSYQLSSNQHLIAFIDSIGTGNTPHIVEIANGKATEVYRYTDEFSAADPEKFSEVVQWTIDNYPAKDYGLVLWGHATGWAISTDTVKANKTRAYGQDNGNDSGSSQKWMNITQLARALETLPHFKFIFADCCCFQCIESAYELRKTADYLIGSPAEIPGEGAPYKELAPLFFSESGTFYKDICDAYYKEYLDGYPKDPYYNYLAGYSVPMSAIDLNQMDALAEATAKVMKTFVPQWPAELDLSGMPFYFAYDKPVMYDTKSVIHKHAAESDYKEWLAAYNKAVPYQLVSRRWMTEYNSIYNNFDQFPSDDALWGCTSMFFPQSKYANATYQYNQRISQMQWYYAVAWSSYF